MMTKNNFYLLSGIIFLVFSFGILLVGDAPWSSVWKGILDRFSGEGYRWNPLLDERLPRLIVLLCTGASLAVSGAVLQALFHNPLASPSILGITAGGSLCIIFVFLMGWQTTSPYILPVAAVIGSLGTLMLVYMLSKRNGRTSMGSLILTGIAISTVLFAIQSSILYSIRDNWQLFSTLSLLEIGTSNDRSWMHVHLQLPLTIVGLLGCWRYRKEINILTLGDEDAANLGIEVEHVRWRLFLFVSLLTGGTLAAIGVIAFFGLVLPHIIRYLLGPDNSVLIPMCIVIGSITMVGLDLFLRLLHIHTFSIGNISTVLGGIFFLMLLFRRRESEFSSC